MKSILLFICLCFSLAECIVKVVREKEEILKITSIRSPSDYSEYLDEKIKRIEITKVVFNDEIVQHLDESFAKLKNLKAICITSCIWSGNTGEKFAKVLVCNPNIDTVILWKDFGKFAYLFFKALASSPAYLKSFSLSLGEYYRESGLKEIKNEIFPLARAFSLLEEVTLIPYSHRENGILAFILPLMSNLKRITLSQGLYEGSMLPNLLRNAKIEYFSIHFCDQSVISTFDAISKMKNLKILTLSYWGKGIPHSKVGSCLSNTKLEILELKGEFYNFDLEELTRITTLKAVSVPFLFEADDKFEKYYKRFSFTYKNAQYPFEITKNMTVIPQKDQKILPEQTLNRLFDNVIPGETSKISLFTMKCPFFPEKFLRWARQGKGNNLIDLNLYIGASEEDPIIESLAYLPKLKNFYLKRYDLIAGSKAIYTMKDDYEIKKEEIIL